MGISGETLAFASAAGAFSYSGAPAEDDTVTIGSVVYTFKDTPTAAFEVATDTDEDVAMQNLADAINGDLAGTAAHPYVSASVDAANDELDLVALVEGGVVDHLALAATSPGTNSITAGAAALGLVSGAVSGGVELGVWAQGMLDHAQIYSAAIAELRRLTPAVD